MMKTKSLGAQFKTLLPTLGIVYGITILGLSIIIYVSRTADIPISFFTRDTTTLLKGPAYAGLISNVGVLIWCAAAAISFFAYGTLKKQKYLPDWGRFFFFSGIVITYLMLDDFFLFHENISRKTSFSQANVYSTYAVFFLFYLILFRKKILDSDFLSLFLAFAFFGLSMVMDVVEDKRIIRIPEQYLFEDGLKLMGLVSWLVYFAQLCSDKINQLSRS